MSTSKFIVTLIPTIESEDILLLVLWELFVVEIVPFIGGLVSIIKFDPPGRGWYIQSDIQSRS